MKLSAVRIYARSLPEVTEQPHFELGSFRVRGKIFVTMPPGEEHIHVFAPEPHREHAFAMYPEWTEKLLWGGKVVGIRVALASAPAAAVKALIKHAWEHKAPKALLAQARASEG